MSQSDMEEYVTKYWVTADGHTSLFIKLNWVQKNMAWISNGYYLLLLRYNCAHLVSVPHLWKFNSTSLIFSLACRLLGGYYTCCPINRYDPLSLSTTPRNVSPALRVSTARPRTLSLHWTTRRDREKSKYSDLQGFSSRAIRLILIPAPERWEPWEWSPERDDALRGDDTSWGSLLRWGRQLLLQCHHLIHSSCIMVLLRPPMCTRTSQQPLGAFIRIGVFLTVPAKR